MNKAFIYKKKSLIIIISSNIKTFSFGLTKFPVKTTGRESANGICGIGIWKWIVDSADLDLLAGDSSK